MDVHELIQRERGHRDIVIEETREALAAYYGGDKLLDFIYPFSRTENFEKLQWRRYLTLKHYRNYPKEIGHKYLEGLFRGHSITRKYNDENFDHYLVSKYDSWFRRNVAMQSLYLPEFFVACSMPGSEMSVITRQDEIDMQLTPYPVVIYPHHVRDFALDAEGNVLWIAFDVPGGHEVYTETDFVQMRQVQGSDALTIESQKPHGFSRCPVVRIAYEDNAQYADCETPVGHAFMKEIVALSIGDLQYRSMLVDATYQHLFLKIVMGEETARATLTGGMGNNTVITEAEGEHGSSRYLATPNMEITTLRTIIYQDNPAQIYQQARLRDHSATIAQSGLAKTFDMVPETGALSAVAEYLSVADMRICDLLYDGWLGTKADDEMRTKARVTYPASFDVRSPLEMMGQFAQFVGLSVTQPLPTSETFVREAMKDMQRGLLPNASADILRLIDDETDNAPFASLEQESQQVMMEQQQNQAPLGAPIVQ